MAECGATLTTATGFVVLHVCGWKYLTMPQNTVFLQLTQSIYVAVTAICCLSSEKLGKKQASKQSKMAFKRGFNTKT